MKQTKIEIKPIRDLILVSRNPSKMIKKKKKNPKSKVNNEPLVIHKQNMWESNKTQ